MPRSATLAAAALMLSYIAAPALAGDPAVALFKIVTVKDDIVIGLTQAELARLGATDAGAVARAIAANGEMTAWQYAVRKSGSGELQQAPLRRIGVLANGSLRVEPYATPLTVVAP